MERSYEEEWFEETNIGRKIKEFLEKDSWKIEKFNENKKQQGPDIVATKNGKKIVIEVKGYPPRYYVVGKKKGQPKPTHPNLEAKHWFADALLSVVVEKSRNPKIKVGIGLPLFPKYEELIGKVSILKEPLNLEFYLVEKNGRVKIV